MPFLRGEIGVPWFTREEWEKLLTVADDREDLPDRYEDWLHRTSEQFEFRVAHGHPLVKVHVRVEELVPWCRAERRRINAAARNAFVAYWIASGRDRGIP